MIIGAFVTLKQKRLKKLLAYSGVNHVGYLLLGLSFFTVDSISAVFLYLLVYMVTGVCAWGVVSALNKADATSSSTPTIGSLAGLVKTNPMLALIFSLCLFSLGGIPPLLGFYAKFGIFQVALNSGFFVVGFRDMRGDGVRTTSSKHLVTSKIEVITIWIWELVPSQITMVGTTCFDRAL